jgi:hypothetical protein
MLKKKHLIVCTAVLAAFIWKGNCMAQAQTTIIDKGISKASIYVDAKAPSSAKRAATELQTHLKLVSGVELPIISNTTKLSDYIIYLGDTDFARKQGIKVEMLPHDGYRILSGKNWLVVAGRDYSGPVMVGWNNPWRLHESYNSRLDISAFGDAGTLFGVYHFLERVAGVRWYMPGPLGTVSPKRSSIIVPEINERKQPAFEHRHPYYGFMEQSDDDALWYRRAGFGTPAPVHITHSFSHFFAKYKDTNPEYFALIAGQRDFGGLSTAEGGGNLNLSDPGLLQQVIKDIGQYFDENPTQKVFPLCPPDGMVRISEDPVSQAQLDKSMGETGEFSNYVWGFINKVAKGIGKTHPGKLVGCIAYERYTLPPSNIERLEPNVSVVICKFRAQYPDAKVKKLTEETVAGWRKKADTIYSWEYYCNIVFNSGWKGYPMFFTNILQDDLKSLKGVIKGEFIEAESWTTDAHSSAPDQLKINYPGLMHPLLYINARLLWNPDLNLKALLDEYYKLFYGPAEEPMRAFWELVDSNWMKKGWSTSPTNVYDGGTIIKLLDHLKDAQKKSAEGSVYRQRVDLIYSEFSPAAELGQRLATLSKPSLSVPALTTEPSATADAIPALTGGSTPVQMLDRSYLAASPATNIQLGWDAKNLYIDLRCYEPDMAKLKALATERDSMNPPSWDDDVVEIFLAGDPADPAKCVHYIVNANAAVFDATLDGLGKGQNFLWNGNAKITAKKEAARWIVQMAVPWADLSIKNPQEGQKLMVSFYRSRQAGQPMVQSSWTPLQDGAFYSPQNFGTLNLAGPGTSEAATAAIPTKIQPASTKDYGSGASVAGFYGEGGIAGAGLFVGQPNNLARNDRAIFRFDLRPLTEAVEKIEKVELQFYVGAIAGDKSERDLHIEHLKQPVETIGSSVVSERRVDDAGTVTVNQEDALLGAVDKSKVKAKSIDVTALIKADLAKGYTSTVFRWRDVLAEKEGNPKVQATGVSLSGETQFLPALIITTKK